jgi:pyruvate dehydrogenase E2 component (dihydrolipoamide acetyltransferase)
VVLADVEQSLPKSATREPADSHKELAASGKKSVKIRRLVARKMVESWQNIPHFFVTVAVDMTDIIRFRKDLEVSINDFILEATARSLKEHPWVNSFWGDGEGVEQPQINISMAVATERGLYNPVVHDCGALSLKEISKRAAELADKAHRGKLTQQDMDGGTFTISNMGMLGVETFSAIITPPQAAVLAVGTIKGEVVVDDKGEPGIAPILRLTLSADHRILDGADAADFLTTLKSYLEAPVTLLSCS